MKRHWYSVKLTYRKRGREIFSTTREVGLLCQAEILDHRVMKKALCGFLRDDMVRRFLCNGDLNFEVVCYLGHFKKGAPSLSRYLAQKFGCLFDDYFIWQVQTMGTQGGNHETMQ